MRDALSPGTNQDALSYNSRSGLPVRQELSDGSGINGLGRTTAFLGCELWTQVSALVRSFRYHPLKPCR